MEIFITSANDLKTFSAMAKRSYRVIRSSVAQTLSFYSICFIKVIPDITLAQTTLTPGIMAMMLSYHRHLIFRVQTH